MHRIRTRTKARARLSFRLTSPLLFLPVVIYVSLAAAASVTSNPGRAAVRVPAKPGARVAWVAVARERVAEHMENRGAAGMATAGPDGSVEVVPPGEGDRLALGAVDIDDGLPITVTPETPEAVEEQLSILATAGRASITVEAGQIHIVYARKRGHAWTYHAHDGGRFDADGESNGRIEIPLDKLESLKGAVPPPGSSESGDVVIALEPRTLRSGNVVIP